MLRMVYNWGMYIIKGVHAYKILLSVNMIIRMVHKQEGPHLKGPFLEVFMTSRNSCSGEFMLGRIHVQSFFMIKQVLIQWAMYMFVIVKIVHNQAVPHSGFT